jgi:hypothetical protein
MPTLLENQKLIEEIKGIRRVVINTCYGGFGLSDEALIYYLKLQGIKVWPEPSKKFSGLLGDTLWLVPPGADRVEEDLPAEKWQEMTMAERQAHNQKYSEQIFNDRDIARDDPYLVKTVLDLGERANGRHAELKVVSLPENVNWTIDEYDGMEHVAERHRTWS